MFYWALLAVVVALDWFGILAIVLFWASQAALYNFDLIEGYYFSFPEARFTILKLFKELPSQKDINLSFNIHSKNLISLAIICLTSSIICIL